MLRNFLGSLGVKDFELGAVGLGLTGSCDLSRSPVPLSPPAAHAVDKQQRTTNRSLCAGI